ncbi:MAG: hypothetical protein ACUZ8H_02470 [Candidatus Anammoxibacter sp.]
MLNTMYLGVVHMSMEKAPRPLLGIVVGGSFGDQSKLPCTTRQFK